jgi:hypothetical protein
MRTHYDNLNVSENAPEEVIRAAYKALALRFHPDRNNGSAESRRVMQILNEAYEVLSDSTKRREYDRLLVAVRAQGAARSQAATQPDSFPKRQPQPKAAPVAPSRGILVGLLAFIFSDFRITLVVIGLCIWGFTSLTAKKTPSRAYSPSSTTPSYTPSSYTPPPARPKWVRPSLSPAGTPWPTTAGYVSGYQIQAQGGLSTVTIDNTSNSSDVFLKLVWLSSSEAIPARMCYIPAYSRFTFSSVMAGRYDVRYRDLTTGGLSKTEEFILEERATYSGTSYSTLSMTLYKVANGNMTTESIDESEF